MNETVNWDEDHEKHFFEDCEICGNPAVYYCFCCDMEFCSRACFEDDKHHAMHEDRKCKLCKADISGKWGSFCSRDHEEYGKNSICDRCFYNCKDNK